MYNLFSEICATNFGKEIAMANFADVINNLNYK
jgi:hypothetical protein